MVWERVVEVSAINKTQIEVTFSAKVDETTAEDTNNYKLNGTSLNSTPATDAEVELQADGKTVMLTAGSTGGFGAGLTANTGYSLEIEKVKNETETQTLDKTIKAFVYNDTIAPTLVSAKAKAKTSTNKINLVFSEPVDLSVASITVNGNLAAISVGTGSKANEVTVTTTSNLMAGSTYNISMLNVKDTEGNLMSVNPFATTVTVEADTTAPTVTGVNVVRDSLVEVTFDKSMDASTITNSTVSILNSNLGTTGIIQGSVTAKANTSNKTFLVPVSALPFNNGTFSGVIRVANTVKDAAGNTTATYTQNVSITEDTTAPQVASSSYKKVTTYNGVATANGAIVVKYNEPVTPQSVTYTVIDNKTGSAVSTPFSSSVINPNDDTEVVHVLNAGVQANSTTYTVIAPTGAVEDKALGTNSSASASLTVDVSAGAPTTADTTAPVAASASETAATTSTSGTTIAVAYTETGSGLDVATVTNTNNYRLDGAALPSGSYITVSGTTATINIPANSIAKDKNYTLNVNNIKDNAGNVMTPFVDNAITLKDDIMPEMTSAVLNSNGTASIGFSEDVVAASGTEADFEVTLNGKVFTGSNLAYTMADGAGADAGKYVLSAKIGTIGKAATAGTYTDPNGGTWTTANATDVVEFKFIDMDGDQDLSAGDIILSGTDTGATTAITFTDSEVYDLNNATSLKIKTVATPSNVKDTSSLTNALKGNKTITIK